MTTKRKIYAVTLIVLGIFIYILPRLFNVEEAGMLAGAAGFLCLLFAFMLLLKKDS